MQTRRIKFPALHIDRCVAFRGTPEEQEYAERKEKERYAQVEKIIFSKSFRSMQYVTDYGQIRVLHFSTRPGSVYTVSYIDCDGIPAMHECFIPTQEKCHWAVEGKRELINLFVGGLYEDDFELEVWENVA